MSKAAPKNIKKPKFYKRICKTIFAKSLRDYENGNLVTAKDHEALIKQFAK
jgi:hypothetical protein